MAEDGNGQGMIIEENIGRVSEKQNMIFKRLASSEGAVDRTACGTVTLRELTGDTTRSLSALPRSCQDSGNTPIRPETLRKHTQEAGKTPVKRLGVWKHTREAENTPGIHRKHKHDAGNVPVNRQGHWKHPN
mgnify:CR=1 FL=1